MSQVEETRTSVLGHPLSHYLRREWVSAYIRAKVRGIHDEIRIWTTFALMHIPGRIGSRIRLARTRFKRSGRHVRIEEMAWIKCPEKISLGDYVRIHPLVFLDGTGGIDIGSHVGVGCGTQIYSLNHRYQDSRRPYEEQGYEFGKVIIEDDVWIGARSIILAGVRVGRGTVIAAGSVVTKDTEPYSVVAGVPARMIKKRVAIEAQPAVQ